MTSSGYSLECTTLCMLEQSPVLFLLVIYLHTGRDLTGALPHPILPGSSAHISGPARIPGAHNDAAAGCLLGHTCTRTRPSFNFLCVLKSCHRHIGLTGVKARIVVCLHGNHQERYSTSSKPDTSGAGPSNLISNKLASL